jgi:hypothetical protein
MIKVGQIYQYEDVGKFVISNIQDNEEFYNPSIIWQDGSVDTLKAMRKSMKIYGKLIAEYPTWQEAVNSPEFKGEK